ncbi:MAG: hypothetical protein ACYS1A_02760 [Planctomycetota bacterium]
MAIIAAHQICLVFEQKKEWMYKILILSVILSVIFFLHRLRKTNSGQLSKIDYVLSITDVNAFVYDGDATFNVFRKDIDYFWFSTRPNGVLAAYQKISRYKYDVLDSIGKFKPKVISTKYIENLGDDRIVNHYSQSSEFHDLFIRKDRQN